MLNRGRMLEEHHEIRQQPPIDASNTYLGDHLAGPEPLAMERARDRADQMLFCE